MIQSLVGAYLIVIAGNSGIEITPMRSMAVCEEARAAAIESAGSAGRRVAAECVPGSLG